MPLNISKKDEDTVESPKEFQLETLLQEITPDNLHAEIDTGMPIGKEVW